MALNEIETQRVRKIVGDFVEQNRPPSHIRQQLDLGFRINGQSIELFEIRPVWGGSPGEMLESAFAKATFVRTSGMWKLYWRRTDLKWHSYPPAPEVASLEVFLALVGEDKHHCFKG